MNKTKWLKGLLVGCLATASVATITACDLFQKVPEGFNGFRDGQTSAEVVLGEVLEVSAYVDFVQWDPETETWMTGLDDDMLVYADHEVTMTMPGEKTIKLTGRGTYDLDGSVKPGDWTLTYEITEQCVFKGTWEMTLTVLAPEITVGLTLDESNSTLYYGDTVEYEEVFSALNLDIKSYYKETVTFSKVQVGEEEISLAGTSSYKLENLGEHIFTLLVTNVGGQSYTRKIPFNVEYRSIYNKAIYLPEGTTGMHTIPVTDIVSNVQINGDAVQAADMNVTASGLQISNALLRQYPGKCVVSFTMESGEINAANFAVYAGDVDFEDGVNTVIASYGTYAQDGLGGKTVVKDDVGAAGNMALEGQSGQITNLMNFNFDTNFLTAIFTGGAEYFTFDMICDVPYLRFVREGGYYVTGPDTTKSVNSYLVADANDVGFGEYTEELKYNGTKLYRFSLVYRKASWLAVTNNGTQTGEGEYMSTVVFDFSSEVDMTSKYENGSKQEAFAQVTQNITQIYIDNIRIGGWNSDDITYADGNIGGQFVISKAGTTGGANSVVKFGDDYALKHVTTTRCMTNTAAFGIEMGYLHEVFNVAGAKALTFKVYLEDTNKVDNVKLYLSGIGTSTVNAEIPRSEFDEENKCFTYTISKEMYSKYFDANGNYKANSFSGLASISALRMGMSSMKYKEAANGVWGNYASGKGTVLYFDDFMKVM